MITRVSRALAWLVLGGFVAQFYLAGAALFGATTFQPHRALGTALGVAVLLLLVVVLIARAGRRVVGLAAILMALTIVQLLLPSLRSGLPWIAALHVANAVALVWVTVGIARAPGQAVQRALGGESVRRSASSSATSS